MSPVIFKIKFYSNNSKTVEKNVAHVNYIATRPGVDKVENMYQEDEEISFEYVKKDMSDIESHVNYINERPRSNGLFDDKDKVINLKDIKTELREHKGIVWRSVLSLKEEDAIKLGYVDRKQWEETLRSHLPEAVKFMGIEETNLRWIAAFHQEKGHPHVHIMFWEKHSNRTKGKLGEWEIKNIKKTLIKGLYEKERARLYAEKTATRDLIRDLTKNDLSKVVDLIREIKNENVDVKILEGKKEGVVQKLWTDKERELSKYIIDLSKIMPKKGRIALKYMPEEVKEKVKQISDWILKQPGFNNNLNIIKEDAIKLAKEYTSDAKSLNDAKENAYIDIRNRVSQMVLKAAVECKANEKVSIDKEKIDNAVKLIKNAHEIKIGYENNKNNYKLIEKEILKNMSKILLQAEISKEGVKSFIKNFKEKACLKINDIDLKKIIDEAYIKYNESLKWGRLEKISNKDWNNLFKNLGYKKHEIPKNMYLDKNEKKQYTKINETNITNKVWKAVWRAIEEEKYKEGVKAQQIKKQLNRNKDNYRERE